MHAAEDVGLIKFDILGIRNLSFLRESVINVRKTKGIDINLRKLPLDDKKTFEMISRGYYGCFPTLRRRYDQVA
jgi:DNA polymerase III subunit alpha